MIRLEPDKKDLPTRVAFKVEQIAEALGIRYPKGLAQIQHEVTFLDSIQSSYGNIIDKTLNSLVALPAQADGKFSTKILFPNTITQIRRREAIQVFSFLPYPCESPINLHLYSLSWYWMAAREYDLSCTLRFLNLRAKGFKAFADLQEKRYLLCRGLIEEGFLPPDFTPAGMWLIWQYQNSLFLKTNAKKPGSIHQSFQRRKQQLEILDKTVSEGHALTTQASSPFSFEEIISVRAGNLSRTSPDFDRNYYNPWVRAEKSWNNARRKLQYAGIPSSRGPKLGSKQKYYGM